MQIRCAWDNTHQILKFAQGFYSLGTFSIVWQKVWTTATRFKTEKYLMVELAVAGTEVSVCKVGLHKGLTKHWKSLYPKAQEKSVSINSNLKKKSGKNVGMKHTLTRVSHLPDSELLLWINPLLHPCHKHKQWHDDRALNLKLASKTFHAQMNPEAVWILKLFNYSPLPLPRTMRGRRSTSQPKLQPFQTMFLLPLSPLSVLHST